MAQVDSIQELGQVFLPLSLNGRQGAPYYYFILDTGAGMSALEQQVAADLKLITLGETDLAGTAGISQVPLKQIESIAPLRRLRPVQELIHYGLVTTSQDLSQFHLPMPDTPETGLLGNDYLRQFVVEIEFTPPALHLNRPQGYLPPGVDKDTYLPMWLDSDHIMRVKGLLDGWLEVELRVDSGAATLQGIEGPYLNITTSLWKKLLDKRNSNSKSSYDVYTKLEAGGMGGIVSLEVGKISSFELGPLKFENPSVVIQPEQGIFANPEAVGFISLNLFEPGGWLTFDYPASRIYLPPVPR